MRAFHSLSLAAALALAAPSGALAGSAAPRPSTASDPADAAESPRLALRGPAKRKSAVREEERTRRRLLERIRSEAEDPATCFLPGRGEELLPATAGRPVTDEEIETLLREVLAGFEAHEQEYVAAASDEMADEAFEELAYFGSADHLLHPAPDYYKDPQKALQTPALHLDKINPNDFDIPVVLNEKVQRWMVYFLTRGRPWFVRWLGRGERYIPLLRTRLAEAGLPQDLVYQAMIESGFNPYATSRAKAVGVWQFMSYTGRAYGLQIDWWTDERRNPDMATDAAIRYLSYLYRFFGEWKLASAAYNAGEGKIQRAIKRYGTRDIWELSAEHRTYLKPETKNYVPKIMAAAILAKYADRYGLLSEIKDEDRLSAWDFQQVQVPEATDLSVVAKILDLPEEELQEMNPQLRRWATPPGVQNYPLNVPKGVGDKLLAELEKIPDEERLTFVRHRVGRGETIGGIARRYGVPESAVLKMNSIRDARKLNVGEHLVIPVRAKSGASRTLVHVVASGESLSVIAQKYGLSVQELRDVNALSGDTLAVGQKLTVTTGAPEAVVGDEDTERPAAPQLSVYTVKAGDSLGLIAERHGTSVRSIRALNDLKSDRIRIGQRLKLRSAGGESPAPAATAVYTVRQGDVVGTIAQKHGMSTDALRKLNDLKDDRIYVGQKLKVAGASGSSTESAPADSTRAVTSYTVQKGDVVGTIAEKHGMTADQLRRLNDLEGDRIYVGQKLDVHGSEAPSRPTASLSSYTVRSGDVVGLIAERHGMSSDELRRLNDLKGDRIYVGQKLKVRGTAAASSKSSGASTKTHTVQSGDTLWEIARRYGMSVDALKRLNNLRSNSLRPGQKLTVQAG